MSDKNLVVLCADTGFIIPLAVTIKSIENTLNEHEVVSVLILTPDICGDVRDKIVTDLIKVSVTWKQIPPDEFSSFPKMGLSVTTYYRLVIDRFVPMDCRRVLYLDSDVVVRQSVLELMAEDIDGYMLGACQDMYVLKIGSTFGLTSWPDLGLDPKANYFNAGV